MSTEMTKIEIAFVAAFLSAQRLEKLLKVTQDKASAIRIHQSTLGLNSSLMKIVATIEIALRNTVYNNISGHFGVSNWLQQPPIKLDLKSGDKAKIIAALDSAKRSEYAKKSQAEKAILKAAAFPNGKPNGINEGKYVKAKRANIPVSDGKIIAELTFAFWKRLYGAEYEQQLWRTTLRKTFPNKALTRSQVSSSLEVMYQTRNRLAHQELVFGNRFDKLILAVRFIISELNNSPRMSPQPLEKLLSDDIALAVKAHEDIMRELAEFGFKRTP